MQIAVQRPVRDEGMGVIRGADHDAVEAEQFVIIEQFSPVHVGFSGRKFLQTECQVVLVHIAQRDAVLGGERIEVRLASAPRTDERKVQLITRHVSSEQFELGDDQRRGNSGDGGGFEEFSAIHMRYWVG